MATSRRSLRFQLADDLRDRIVDGELEPGRSAALRARAGAASWACRAPPCGRRSRCSRRTASSAGCTGSGTYVANRPGCGTTSGRNFGVSSMIAAMGLEPGDVDEHCEHRVRACPVAAALGIETGEPVSSCAACARRRSARGGQHRLVPRRRHRARTSCARRGRLGLRGAGRARPDRSTTASRTSRPTPPMARSRSGCGVSARRPAADHVPGRQHGRRHGRRSSRASTTWPTPSRSRSTGAGPSVGATRRERARPRRSGSTSDRRARARRLIEASGKLVGASLRRASRSRIRARTGPSRTRASGCRRCAQALARGHPREPGRRESQRSRSARSSTGWCAVDAGGEPVRPALIWMDRRAGAECDDRGRAASIRPGCASSRAATSIPATSRRRSPGCAAHEPEAERGGALVPAARAPTSRGTRPACWRSTRRTRPRRCCSTCASAAGRARRARRSASTRRACLRSRLRTTRARAGRRRGCARPPGSTASTLVVLGCGDEMAGDARRGRRRAGRRVRRHGHGGARLRRRRRAGARPVGRRRAASARRSRELAAREPRAGSRAAPTAGSATSWGTARWTRAARTGDDVYELLNAVAAEAPAGRRRRRLAARRSRGRWRPSGTREPARPGSA